VALLGPKNVTLENNTINGNQKAGTDDHAGGVLLVSSKKSDGGDHPVGNTIRGNTVLNNQPLDIVYDGTGSGNTFPGNDCRRSAPSSICA
jgi:hypothetical protein